MHYKYATNCFLYCIMHYICSMEKSFVIQIRVTEAEKDGFTQSADLAGISLSSWVRERLRLAAIRELESAGRQIPFVANVLIRPKQNNK